MDILTYRRIWPSLTRTSVLRGSVWRPEVRQSQWRFAVSAWFPCWPYNMFALMSRRAGYVLSETDRLKAFISCIRSLNNSVSSAMVY
jgi:hypothetical protein